MADPFIGEIKMFGGNFAPRGYALCNGQLLSIAQNTALFSIVGTTYGGNGQTTFALPNLQGRFPMHAGNTHVLGEIAGTESVTLLTTQIPAHNHTLAASSAVGSALSPEGNFPSAVPRGTTPPYASVSNTTMAAGAIGISGGNQPHNNMPPYLCVNFIIALEGIFPSRN